MLDWLKINTKVKEKIWDEYNYTTYLLAIKQNESNVLGYDTRNDKKWAKKKVSYKRWAYWKYQFTVETLWDYWIDLKNSTKTWVDEVKVIAFLNNHYLQEKIMIRFVNKNIDRLFRNKTFLTEFKSGERNIVTALLAWHFWGYTWGTTPYMSSGINSEKKKDWLWMNMHKYVMKAKTFYDEKV